MMIRKHWEILVVDDEPDVHVDRPRCDRVGNFMGQEVRARALRDRLAEEPGKVLNSQGDRFVHSGNHVLFSLASTEGAPVFDLVGEPITSRCLTISYG